MTVSGSSIAAHYAGSAALALDPQRGRHAAQQTQAAAEQRLQQFRRPHPPGEQVLEGELLNQARQAQAERERGDVSDGRFRESPPQTPLSANPAIRAYQATARLDGLSGGQPLHQIDLYA